MGVRLRAMDAEEFEAWQRTVADDYAREQVAAGAWPAEGAAERAREQNRQLLPQAAATPRMLFLLAIDDADAVVGRAWAGLDHPRGAADCGFLYDIEIVPEHRGRGLGRALLDGVEAAVRSAGVGALELNVFGGNSPAIALYASSGYTVTTQQMRKRLGDAAP